MTAAALLTARLAADPAAPLITFYDDSSGERVELSAATFANWVAKTANFFVDGLGLERGDRVRLVLPLHWQSLVLVAGAWAAGLVIDLPGEEPGQQAPAATVLAEGFPGNAENAANVPGELVMVSLRPMGAGLLRADETTDAVSASAIDYAADVLGYGDRFSGPAPGRNDLALGALSHGELLEEAHAAANPRRILLAPEGDPPLTADLLGTAYLGPLSGGGSVVLCRHADSSVLIRRAETERAFGPDM